MTDEQWPRIKEIVGAALEKEPSERGAFLDGACSENEPMRREVESLLAAYEDGGGLSESPWEGVAVEELSESQVIGPYRLIRELGVGGMGQVWLAEQTSPVLRQCALKLIRGGIYDSETVRRFQAERQSLALMNHPSIAKVFDAGTTAAGQPYFAMEYVNGLPISEYCDRHKLSIRDRLNLFIQVCEGVQHAHQKAVIHRDIKPSNILVIEVDGKPRPRIIDFGLAKPVEPRREGETLYTQVGALLGTPGYMSPEQADPTVRDIDTRTDVYSLGVVLYELLTGVLPFIASRTKRQHLDEMLRELREDTPPRPSSKVRMSAETLTQRAVDRGSDSGTLVSQLRGDLDWITMKALEKERDRRYGTPTELVADIERHLSDLPVLASKASSGYRLQKYIRRHRVGVAVGTSAALLVIAFAIMQAIQLRRITRERDRADRITDFMTNMFKVPDPSQSRGNTVTAREILDRSSKQIESNLGQDDQVRAQLMEVMALTYSNLGLYARGDELAAQVLDNRERTLGKDDPKTLESRNQVGFLLYRLGHDREAEKMMRETIALEERRLGKENLLTFKSKDDLAIVLIREGRAKEAEQIEREVTAQETRKFGPDHAQTLRSTGILADTIHSESRYAEAEPIFRQLIATQQRILGKDDPIVIALMHNLGNLLQEQGRYDEAEKVYRNTIAIAQRVLGPEHPETLSSWITLANDLRHSDAHQTEAEAIYRRSLAILLPVYGLDSANTTRAQEGLGNLLSNEGKYDEAQKLLGEVLASRKRLLGPDHTDTLISQYNLGCILIKQRHLDEAEQSFRETVAAQSRVLGPDDPDTLASESALAHILLLKGKPEEGEKLAQAAFAAQNRILGPQHEDTLESLHFLGDAMVQTHQDAEAEKVLQDVIKQTTALKGGDSSTAWYIYGCISAVEGHKDEAFDHLNQAIKGGFNDTETLKAHPDLKSLRSDPRFPDLLARAAKAHPAGS